MKNRKGLPIGATAGALLFGLSAVIHGAKKPTAPPMISEVQALSAHYQAQQLRSLADPGAAPWQARGPWGVGRINEVVADPSNDQIIYVGAAGGSVWKSTNGGDSYAEVFTDCGSLGCDQSIGAIAVDPNNSQIVWIGGGENMYGGGSHTYPGTGIFKSANGGQSWQHMGLDSSFYISRISVTPGNSNKVFVAVQGSVWGTNDHRGVYRTEDGGDSWTQVLGPLTTSSIDNATGAKDVRVHPTIPDRVFASFFTANRQPYARTWGGPNSRVWLSEDGGDSWTVMGAGHGLPTSDLGGSTIDFCAGTPNTAYMVYSTAANTMKGVYRSTNGGLNWTRTSGNPNGSRLFSYYAHTFLQIRVNPTNPNHVAVLGISSDCSTNGGSSWSQCMSGTHADHRSMAWSRTNGNVVYLGDDGSLKRSTSGTNGSFSSTGGGSGGMNIAQLYSMDVAPDNANYIYIGLQDNGGDYTTNGGNSWNTFVGGDGMQMRVDHGNSNYVLGCLQYGNCTRSSNRGSSRSGISYPGSRKLWDAGMAIDSVTGYSYLGSQYVSRANRGSGTYTQISGDLTNGDHSAANYPMGTVSAISAHNNVVFAGTDDGNVWVRQDGSAGGTGGWTRIRNGNNTGPGTGDYSFDGWVKLISPDYNVSNGSAAYVAVSYWRWGHRYWRPSIFHLTNYGLGGVGSSDWRDITGDLPPFITTNKVVADYRGYLYAATDYGVYYSTNDGVNWGWLGDLNLPVVPVNDIVIHQSSGTIYIGTYGRGFWTYPLDQVTPVEKGVVLRAKGQVLKNFPNPVVNTTRVEFRVANAQSLNVAVYDLTGRKIKQILNEKVKANEAYTRTWDRTDQKGIKVAKGNYILRAYGPKVTMATKISVK